MFVPDRDCFLSAGFTTLHVAGTRCALRASDEQLLRTLAQFVTHDPPEASDFSLAVQVANDPQAMEPAHFRGMGHLVIAILGGSTFLFDLQRKEVHACIIPAMANDLELWAGRLFPLMLGVLGCSIDLLPLHAACVVRDGRGILICGESMAGKSTLSVALAQQDFELLSDDWTYIRSQGSRLLACGLDVPVKLLPDAVSHFPDLRSVSTQRSLNGEIAYEVSAQTTLGVRVTRACLPSAIVFLERASRGEPQVVRESGSIVQQYINNSVERLPRELRGAEVARERLVNAIASLPAWRYRYCGSPQAGANALSRFFEQQEEVRNEFSPKCSPGSSKAFRPHPLQVDSAGNGR